MSIFQFVADWLCDRRENESLGWKILFPLLAFPWRCIWRIKLALHPLKFRLLHGYSREQYAALMAIAEARSRWQEAQADAAG